MKTFGITILLTSLLVSTPVSAQTANVDQRVDRLEQEMRAVQRKVFPGGSTRSTLCIGVRGRGSSRRDSTGERRCRQRSTTSRLPPGRREQGHE